MSFIKPPKAPGPSMRARAPPVYNAMRVWREQREREEEAALAAAASSATRAPGRPQCPNKGCRKPNVVDGVCQTCGRVADDSNIVSEVQFGETSTGAAVIQGSYIGADQAGVRSTGPAFRRMGGANEAREKSIREARQLLQGYAEQLRLSQATVDSAVQCFKLASINNFVQGRTMRSVTAVCLYTACRNETPCRIMLIDLADLIQVNVFKLGRIYKAFNSKLMINAANGPVVPEDLMFRFAMKLEFGHETQKVAEDAIRLVRRMARDWIVMGRRPSGICGACLLMAARMHNFRRTVREVVYVVKVTTHTIECRLTEFKDTESSHMSIEDFFSQDFLESAHDPPSFYQKTEEYQKKMLEQGRKRKRKRQEADIGGPDEAGVGRTDLDWTELAPPLQGPSSGSTRSSAATPTAAIDMSSAPAVEYRRDAEGFIIPPRPAIAEDGNSEYSILAATQYGDANSDVSDLPTPAPSSAPVARGSGRQRPPLLNVDEAWEADEQNLEAQISEIMNDPESLEHAKAFMAAEKRAHVHTAWAMQQLPQREISMAEEVGADEFANDPEVQHCLLDAHEIAHKEAIWNHYNKDWLRKQQEKIFREKMERDRPKQRRNRRKRARIGEGQTSPASTPQEAAVAMLKRRGFSKRINYDAIEGLFAGVPGSAAGSTRTSLAGSVYGEAETPAAESDGELESDDGHGTGDDNDVGEGGDDGYDDYYEEDGYPDADGDGEMDQYDDAD